jgi:hypothetical protein
VLTGVIGVPREECAVSRMTTYGPQLKFTFRYRRFIGVIIRIRPPRGQSLVESIYVP